MPVHVTKYSHLLEWCIFKSIVAEIGCWMSRLYTNLNIANRVLEPNQNTNTYVNQKTTEITMIIKKHRIIF